MASTLRDSRHPHLRRRHGGGVVVMGLGSADLSMGRVHPTSIVMVVAYMLGLAASRCVGLRVAARRRKAARAGGGEVEEQVEGERAGLRGKIGDVGEVGKEERRLPTSALFTRFSVLAIALSVAGFGLSVAGSNIADQTFLSATAVGLFLTALATSTPELVTAVAAARRGAIGLAAGDIIGGNVFDTLFIAAADLASPQSVFSGVPSNTVLLVGFAVLLNGILLSGLMRKGEGTKQIDLESLAIVVLWLLSVVVVLV